MAFLAPYVYLTSSELLSPLIATGWWRFAIFYLSHLQTDSTMWWNHPRRGLYFSSARRPSRSGMCVSELLSPTFSMRLLLITALLSIHGLTFSQLRTSERPKAYRARHTGTGEVLWQRRVCGNVRRRDRGVKWVAGIGHVKVSFADFLLLIGVCGHLKLVILTCLHLMEI